MSNLLNYIPKKFHPAVSKAWRDEDGYWVTLKDGWRDGIMDTHVIHTDTIKELREEARLIYKED